MYSDGEMWTAGQTFVSNYSELPASSIIQADLLKQREDWDKVFRAGDEVVVVLDCTAHTLRLQSPTVDYLISIQQPQVQNHWVLNVEFGGGDHEVQLLQ